MRLLAPPERTMLDRFFSMLEEAQANYLATLDALADAQTLCGLAMTSGTLSSAHRQELECREQAHRDAVAARDASIALLLRERAR